MNSLATHKLMMDNASSSYSSFLSPAAVDVFYGKVVADEKLADFFKGITIETLKEHQRKFLRMAFTTIPKSINVEEFMFDKHKRLFLEGLSEVHFDLVAGHFVATLEQLNVPADQIKEATDIVVPLRPIFEQGAANAQKHEEEKKEEDERQAHLLERIGGEPALKAAVNEFYTRLVVDKELERFFVGVPLDVLKSHQEKFMRLAFTNAVPADMDVADHMRTKHYRLFAMGLDETHFDKVATHFVETLQHLGVSQSLIDEAVGHIAPLRAVFEKGLKK